MTHLLPLCLRQSPLAQPVGVDGARLDAETVLLVELLGGGHVGGSLDPN